MFSLLFSPVYVGVFEDTWCTDLQDSPEYSLVVHLEKSDAFRSHFQ